MGVYKFINGDHGNKLFSAISEFWKEERFCDCSLVVDSVKVQLHKLVLLAAWPSVMTSFSVMEDNGHAEIYLPDFIKPKALAEFVSYIYDGEILVTHNNIDTLEYIADSLSDDVLTRVCKDFRETFDGTEENQTIPKHSHGRSTCKVNKLSEMHKRNINTLNNVKNSNSSVTGKRKLVSEDEETDAKKKKTSSADFFSSITAENKTVPNGTTSGALQQVGAIKVEPESDESDSGCAFDSVNNVNKRLNSGSYQGDFKWNSQESNSCNPFFTDEKASRQSFDDQGDDTSQIATTDSNKAKIKNRIGRKYRNYTQEMLTSAFYDVKSGKHSVLRAAKIYGVPEETLRDKIKGRRKLDCTQGRSHCFTEEEEHKILDTLEFYGKHGYRYRGVDIVRIVTRFAVDFRKRINNEEDSADPEFSPKSQRGQKLLNRSVRGLKLTRKWFDGFYQRWTDRLDPFIITGVKTGKSSETPECSKDILDNFFKRYEKAIHDNNLKDKPENIFFVEDMRLFSSVIGLRDEKIQKSVSIAAVSNLAGCTFPPYFVKEDIESDAESFFEEVMGGLHEGEILSLQDHLLKCMSCADEGSPRLLLINGDKMFVLIGIEEWADEHNITLVLIPENIFLYIRAFNSAVEGSFQKLIDDNYETSPHLSAAENYKLYKSLVEQEFIKTFTEDKLKHAFSKVGLFPVDETAAKTMCFQSPVPVKKKNVRSGSKYKQYTQSAVDAGIDAVIHGGLSVLKASKIYGVPDNTLRDFVKERRAKMVETNLDSVIQDCMKATAIDDNIGKFVDTSLESMTSDSSGPTGISL